VYQSSQTSANSRRTPRFSRFGKSFTPDSAKVIPPFQVSLRAAFLAQYFFSKIAAPRSQIELHHSSASRKRRSWPLGITDDLRIAPRDHVCPAPLLESASFYNRVDPKISSFAKIDVVSKRSRYRTSASEDSCRQVVSPDWLLNLGAAR